MVSHAIGQYRRVIDNVHVVFRYDDHCLFVVCNIKLYTHQMQHYFVILAIYQCYTGARVGFLFVYIQVEACAYIHACISIIFFSSQK